MAELIWSSILVLNGTLAHGELSVWQATWMHASNHRTPCGAWHLELLHPTNSMRLPARFCQCSFSSCVAGKEGKMNLMEEWRQLPHEQARRAGFQ